MRNSIGTWLLKRPSVATLVTGLLPLEVRVFLCVRPSRVARAPPRLCDVGHCRNVRHMGDPGGHAHGDDATDHSEIGAMDLRVRALESVLVEKVTSTLPHWMR